MCLIGVSMKQNKDFPFILAANRDEFYDRPTAALHKWESAGSIYAGKDLEKGGTWMGISKKGYIGALTNVREKPLRFEARSRGELVVNFLKDEEKDPEGYIERVVKNGDWYQGFNLLVGTPETLWFGSNRKERIQRLTNGVFGLSNASLDTNWPKVNAIKKALHEISNESEKTVVVEHLLSALNQTHPYPSKYLTDTGVGVEMERMLSPMFITSQTYGTRCSTIIAMDKNRLVTIMERSYEKGLITDKKVDVQR
ncbi:NRDE family protein [Alteribacter aurantiacus]|uniref:NRDE family protein n=1 Tax=Alteribacter aurantiacus TaxID=254410 RepID=UPI0004239216|nr:NRDE family protein [Alteribacter aurantiacus]